MSNSIMYQADGYVVLQEDQPETLMTAVELLVYLEQILQHYPDSLPLDIQKIAERSQQLQKLMENYCELDLEPGKYLQWYAVRFEK